MNVLVIRRVPGYNGVIRGTPLMKNPLRAKAFSGVMAAALLLCGCTSFDGLVRQEKLNEAAETLETLPAAQRADGYARLAGIYAGKGDYDKAIAYYGKAGDIAALNGLAAVLLERGEYEPYVRCRKEAGKKTLLLEEFGDNARGWNVRKDDYVNASIGDGRLLIDKHNEKGASYLWTACAMDPEKDFRMEAEIAKISGADDNAFSIAWGMKDSDDNYQFGFSGDGHYRYAGVEDGENAHRITWTESAAVRRGNAVNVIAVEKIADAVSFFINGERVGGWRFEGFAGDKVGVSINPKSVIEVRRFSVNQYPSARGPWAEASEAAAKKARYPEALKYAFLSGGGEGISSAAPAAVRAGQAEAVRTALLDAGLSRKAAGIRLASFLQEAGKNREAVEELSKAGWDLSKGFVYTLLAENFDANVREWSVKESEDAAAALRGGKYIMEKKKTGGRYASWNYADLSPDADYRISVSMKKISGADDRTYSLLWGFSDLDTCVDMGILGSGKVQFGYFDNGEWENLIAVSPSEAVRKGNAENRVTVDRSGSVLRVFVNAVEVGSTAAAPITGGKVGFALYQKMAVEYDDLEVVEYAPAFALKLAKDVVFASNPGEYARLAAAMELDRKGAAKAPEGFKSAGDTKGETAGYEALAAQAEAAGDALAAVDYYSQSGNKAKVLALSLKAAAQAAAAKSWAKAAELYGNAGGSEEAYTGLSAAYEALGKKEEAEAAREKLADWYFANKEPDLALETYKTLAKPARLDAAGSKYFAAAEYESAAELFKASGNARREKECYRAQAAALDKAGDLKGAVGLYEKSGDAAALKSAQNRLADGLAAENSWDEALELYKKTGNTARVKEVEKKLAAVTILTGKTAQAGEKVSLNQKVVIVGVARTVVAAAAKERRVTISSVERSAVKKTGDDRTVTFTIRLKEELPKNLIPALYFDFTGSFALFMFDEKNEFRTASNTGNFTVTWKEEESMGFRRVDAKTLQCDVGLVGKSYSSGSYQWITDFDLAGMKGDLTVFFLEGENVWSYVPSGGDTEDREYYNAVSNVFQTKVGF